MLDAAAVEPQLVVTAASVDDVVATAADEPVVAVASTEGVREIRAANLEVAVVEGEGVAVAPAVVARYAGLQVDVDPSRSMLIVDADGRALQLLRLPAMGSDVERVVALAPLNLHPLPAIEGQVEGVVSLRSVESPSAGGPSGVQRSGDVHEGVGAVGALGDPRGVGGAVERDDDSRLVQWRACLPPRAAVPNLLPVDRAVGIDDPVAADGCEDRVTVTFVVPGIDGIVSGTAVQTVAAVGAEQRVVAVAALQFPYIADDGVDAAEAVVAHAARGEVGMDASGRGSVIDGNDPGPDIDPVVAPLAPDLHPLSVPGRQSEGIVVARTGDPEGAVGRFPGGVHRVDDVDDGIGAQGALGHPPRIGGSVDGGVDARGQILVVDRLIGGRTAVRVDNRVIAFGAEDGIIAVGVVARIQNVVAGSAGDVVDAFAAPVRVVAGPAG